MFIRINYLVIEGIEPSQTPKNIFRRMLIWMDSMMNPAQHQHWQHQTDEKLT